MFSSQQIADDTFFQTLATDIKEGVLIIDTSGFVAFANTSIEQYLGYTPGELVEQPIHQLFAEDHRETALEEILPQTDGEHRSEHESVEYDRDGRNLVEFVYVHADGHTVPLVSSVQKIDHDGQLFMAVTLGHDSEHKQEVEQYKTIVETAPVGVFVLDEEGTITGGNENAWELVDHMADELLNEPFLTLVDEGIVTEATIENYLDTVRALLSSKNDMDVGTIEAEITSFDGSQRTYLAHISLLPFEEEFSGTIVVFQDITDRIKRERAERRQSTAMDTSIDGMAITNEDGEFVYMNQTYAEFFGLDTPEDFFGEPLQSLYDDEQLQRFEETIWPTLNREGRWRGEAVAERVDGSTVIVEMSLVALEDGGIASVVRDITERKEREREARLQSAAIESSIDGIAILNEAAEFVYVNQAYTNLYGYDTREEIVGEPFYALYDDEERQRLEQEIWPSLQTNGHWRGESIGMRADGSVFPREWSLTVVEDGGYISVVRDITERKKREHQFETLNETTRELMLAQDDQTIARLATEAIERVFGFTFSCMRLFDSSANTLNYVVLTDEAEELINSRQAFDMEATRAGRAYRRADTVFNEQDEDNPGAHDLIRSSLHVPLGEHGVLSILTTAGEYIEETDVHLAELLAMDIERALDRTQREQLLHEHKEDLLHHRDQLETLDQINVLIRDIIHSLPRAQTREEIDQTVCDCLAESDLYDYALIGDREVTGEGITPRTGAGAEADFLRVLQGAAGSPRGSGDLGEAMRTGEIQITRQYSTTEHNAMIAEEDRTEVETIATVPLAHDDRINGVLVVSSTRPDAFSEQERAGFSTLSGIISFVVAAVATKKLILSDTSVELELEVTDGTGFFVEVSDRLQSTCVLEASVTLPEGNFIQYVDVDGASPEDIRDAITSVNNIEECRFVSQEGDTCLIEVNTTEPTIHALLEYGASVRTFTADQGKGRIIVEIQPDANIRTIVDTFRARHPTTEVVAKREINRPVQTGAAFRQTIDEHLTKRQQTVISAAYAAGYYDWPRKSTAEEIADSFGISSPTLHQHLRKAEQKLLTAFLDEGSGGTRRLPHT